MAITEDIALANLLFSLLERVVNLRSRGLISATVSEAAVALITAQLEIIFPS